MRIDERDDSFDGVAPESTPATPWRSSRRVAIVVIAVAGLLAVAGIVVALNASGHSKGATALATESDATTTTAPNLTVDPTVPWTEAALLRDDRTLRVPVSSDPSQDSDCHPTFEMQVIELPESVTVAFGDRPRVTPPENMPCDLSARTGFTDVRLAATLGNRPVYNGVDPAPRTIDHWSDLVDPGYLPDGFKESGVNPYQGKDGARRSQLMYTASDSWFLSITQGTANTDEAPPAGAKPITVHGIDGFAFSSFNGSTIQWTEDGLDLQVSGEGAEADKVAGTISGATTYVPEDELLKVAEGLRLPAS